MKRGLGHTTMSNFKPPYITVKGILFCLMASIITGIFLGALILLFRG